MQGHGKFLHDYNHLHKVTTAFKSGHFSDLRNWPYGKVLWGNCRDVFSQMKNTFGIGSIILPLLMINLQSYCKVNSRT